MVLVTHLRQVRGKKLLRVEPAVFRHHAQTTHRPRRGSPVHSLGRPSVSVDTSRVSVDMRRGNAVSRRILSFLRTVQNVEKKNI